MAPKGSSGRRKTSDSKQIAKLRKHAKKGEMPTSIYHGGNPETYNKAFEAINRYYAWPDEEYLRANNVDARTGWRMREERTYIKGVGYRGTGTYYMEYSVKVTPKRGKFGMGIASAPMGSSFEARRGAEKVALYGALKMAKVLDKEQFIVKE